MGRSRMVVEMRCTFLDRQGKHCEEMGFPEPGYDFFVCQDCLNHLEELLNIKSTEAATGK